MDKQWRIFLAAMTGDRVTVLRASVEQRYYEGSFCSDMTSTLLLRFGILLYFMLGDDLMHFESPGILQNFMNFLVSNFFSDKNFGCYRVRVDIF